MTDEEKKEVIGLGGLHVVGTERHVRPSLFWPLIISYLCDQNAIGGAFWLSECTASVPLFGHLLPHLLTRSGKILGLRRTQESRRIDNQLRGRSGRQGDPGSTRYFLSLEDKCAVLAL